MPRRSATPSVRLVLTLWAALALWLVPAAFRGAERRAPARAARAIATPDAAIDGARLPARVETTVRGTLPSLARGGGGTPALVARPTVAPALASGANPCALPCTSRRAIAPRRLAFPVEAIGPPASHS